MDAAAFPAVGTANHRTEVVEASDKLKRLIGDERRDRALERVASIGQFRPSAMPITMRENVA